MIASGSPLMTVTADRSAPHGIATTKWDDEGGAPADFPLVREGILVDFQTSREQAAWIKPWYAQQGRAPLSHGCANSSSALALTAQHTPNLTLHPAASATSLEELIAGTKAGVFIDDATIETDFQGKNGTMRGSVREIVNGALGAYLSNAVPAFSTLELWKNLSALGGAGSAEVWGGEDLKGEPSDATEFSVSAVPLKISGVVVVDGARKA